MEKSSGKSKFSWWCALFARVLFLCVGWTPSAITSPRYVSRYALVWISGGYRTYMNYWLLLLFSPRIERFDFWLFLLAYITRYGGEIFCFIWSSMARITIGDLSWFVAFNFVFPLSNYDVVQSSFTHLELSAFYFLSGFYNFSPVTEDSLIYCAFRLCGKRPIVVMCRPFVRS